MKLEQEMLIKLLSRYKMEVTFPELNRSAEELVELRALDALSKIQDILRDETMNDPECCEKIEEIVSLFEGLGSGCGGRHDWG